MNKQDWAKEPLRCIYENSDDDAEVENILDAEGYPIVTVPTGFRRATGQRIVACYNACSEIPSNELFNAFSMYRAIDFCIEQVQKSHLRQAHYILYTDDGPYTVSVQPGIHTT